MNSRTVSRNSCCSGEKPKSIALPALPSAVVFSHHSRLAQRGDRRLVVPQGCEDLGAALPKPRRATPDASGRRRELRDDANTFDALPHGIVPLDEILAGRTMRIVSQVLDAVHPLARH